MVILISSSSYRIVLQDSLKTAVNKSIIELQVDLKYSQTQNSRHPNDISYIFTCIFVTFLEKKTYLYFK